MTTTPAETTTHPERPETTRLTVTVTVDMIPAPDQTPEQARAEMADNLRQYISGVGAPFMEDYGASLDAWAENARNGEDPYQGAADTLNGYPGPYATVTSVTSTAS